MAGLFAAKYRSAHEPGPEQLIRTVLAASCESASTIDMANTLRARDSKLRLDFEANYLLYYFIDILVNEYPQAKFILTIRDCYTWLDSMINQHYAVKIHHYPQYWSEILDYMFPKRADSHQDRQEDSIRQFDLAPIDSYLAYWAEHNKKLLSVIPSDRLLVIRLPGISTSLPAIADFVGVPCATLDATKTHLHARKEKPINILAMLDSAYLEQKARFHCNEVMQEVFGAMPDLPKTFERSSI